MQEIEILTNLLRKIPGKKVADPMQIKFWFTRKRFSQQEKRQMAKLDTRLGRDENDVNSSLTQAAKCKSTRKWTGYQSQYMESYFKANNRKPSLEEMAIIAQDVDKPVIMVKKWFTYRRSQENQKGVKTRRTNQYADGILLEGDGNGYESNEYERETGNDAEDMADFSDTGATGQFGFGSGKEFFNYASSTLEKLNIAGTSTVNSSGGLVVNPGLTPNANSSVANSSNCSNSGNSVDNLNRIDSMDQKLNHKMNQKLPQNSQKSQIDQIAKILNEQMAAQNKIAQNKLLTPDFVPKTELQTHENNILYSKLKEIIGNQGFSNDSKLETPLNEPLIEPLESILAQKPVELTQAGPTGFKPIDLQLLNSLKSSIASSELNQKSDAKPFDLSALLKNHSYGSNTSNISISNSFSNSFSNTLPNNFLNGASSTLPNNNFPNTTISSAFSNNFSNSFSNSNFSSTFTPKTSLSADHLEILQGIRDDYSEKPSFEDIKVMSEQLGISSSKVNEFFNTLDSENSSEEEEDLKMTIEGEIKNELQSNLQPNPQSSLQTSLQSNLQTSLLSNLQSTTKNYKIGSPRKITSTTTIPLKMRILSPGENHSPVCGTSFVPMNNSRPIKVVKLQNNTFKSQSATPRASNNFNSSLTNQIFTLPNKSNPEDVAELKTMIKNQATQIQTLLKYCHGLEQRIGVLEQVDNCERNSLPESE